MNHRKFDIRMWVLITHELTIYMFKFLICFIIIIDKFFYFREGYLRLSAEKFDLHNFNEYIHLTNNAI